MTKNWIIEYKLGTKRQIDEVVTIPQPIHLSLSNVKANATRLSEHLKGVQKITIYYFQQSSKDKKRKIQVCAKHLYKGDTHWVEFEGWDTLI